MPERNLLRIIFRKKRSKWSLILAGFVLSLLFIFVLGFSFFIYFARDLPRPEKFTERQLSQSTKIYDRTGQVLLYDIYGDEKRTVVPLSSVPDFFIKALLATEDANFYKHHGVDFKSIARSVFINFQLKKPTFGGSTISQQLIRSSFLSTEKTLPRKIKELVLTLELERRYSKEQVLEWYVNQVPFGGNIYGVEAASQTYFNKDVGQLSVPEAATLVALIKAPGYLSQKANREDLFFRKDYVLQRMEKLGFISKPQMEQFQKEEIKFSSVSQSIKAPHFVLYVKDLLEQKYGEDFLKMSGYKVYTSLDWDLQNFAEQTVEEVGKTNESYNAYNTALVSINPKNGEILAFVGSRNWFEDPYPKGCVSGKSCMFEPKYNIVTGTSSGLGRQPGSAFKPFAYATAFRKGYSPDTVVIDDLTEFNPNCDPSGAQEKDQYGLDCYHPKNYDGKFRGEVSLRQSLAQSLNIPSIKTLKFAGIPETIKLAEDMGISTLTDPSRYGLSLVLGGGEVKLLEITSAYGIFATNGLRVPPVSILKIEDNQGNIIEENKKTPKRVLEVEVAQEINSILSDNKARSPVFGSHSLLYFDNYQVAAKTGTTQDYKDGWAIGYTPSIVTGVWVGNNDGTLMNKEPGVVLAGPIFHRVMEKILSRLPKESF